MDTPAASWTLAPAARAIVFHILHTVERAVDKTETCSSGEANLRSFLGKPQLNGRVASDVITVAID
jgi:hypothetical protein